MSENDPQSDVAIFIRKARNRLSMTQEEFAHELNCTKANVSGWENGRHEPHYRMLRSISEKSGIPLPHDKIATILSELGIDAEHIEIDQVEIIKESLTVPKKDRAQAKKILGTFKDSNTEEDDEKSGKQ